MFLAEFIIICRLVTKTQMKTNKHIWEVGTLLIPGLSGVGYIKAKTNLEEIGLSNSR